MSDDWPRVTAVLRAVGLAPVFPGVAPSVLEAAQARGTAVHEAVEALVYGYLEEAEVPAPAAPYVSAFRKFLAEASFEPIAAERLVEHAAWRYRGHVDLVGWLHGHRALVDVKTGDADGAAVQVAAYVDAWNVQHPDQAVVAGAVLHLRDDGTYRYEEVELPAAMPVWHAALVVYQALVRMRRIP